MGTPMGTPTTPTRRRSRPPRRAVRRVVGTRRLDREARRIVSKVLELSAGGCSPRAIASSVGASEEAVRWILQREHELLEGGGA